MCGRFASATPLGVLAERFLVDEVRTDELAPNYNVAPTDPVYAVAEHQGKRLLGAFRWGLVPPEARDPAQGPRPINARAETLLARPAFREGFLRRRCLLPADGFYEWRTVPGGRKQPYFIRPRHGGVLALAGLWATWRGGDEPLRTCAIVTTAANAIVVQLHDRMPVIIAPQHWGLWLDSAEDDLTALRSLLVPASDELLEVYPVTTKVNSVANNGPELLRSVNADLSTMEPRLFDA